MITIYELKSLDLNRFYRYLLNENDEYHVYDDLREIHECNMILDTDALALLNSGEYTIMVKVENIQELETQYPELFI